ncbi:hypothetical protein DUI87_09700 [Hirundo rustica rustica]|uniref:WD repeat-containing protein 54 beta-propeller domain-containing protein n=1 Tax=Hirundo rustica rustica TaxID=333673 RepID=A0A3M0KMZ6_HIRRU|nr:hypothetical protein DUI87_09700 [Hirundo rustica rustica]
MYDSDGSTMVFWHALDVPEQPAGTSFGAVLVFDIPPKGTNVTLSEVLEQHRDPVTDIAAEQGQAPDGAGDLVTADDSGTLCLWSSGEEFTLLGVIPGSGSTCSSVRLWNGIVAAGYGDGQIRLWEAGSGRIRAQVSAHARWIYALDLAPLTGKCPILPHGSATSVVSPRSLRSPQLLSGAEDSFVHVWELSRNPDTDDIEVSPGLGRGTRSHSCSLGNGDLAGDGDAALGAAAEIWEPRTDPLPPQIQHCHAERVTDTQVCGARFCDPAGDTFAVTGYDLSEILCYGSV